MSKNTKWLIRQKAPVLVCTIVFWIILLSGYIAAGILSVNDVFGSEGSKSPVYLDRNASLLWSVTRYPAHTTTQVYTRISPTDEHRYEARAIPTEIVTALRDRFGDDGDAAAGSWGYFAWFEMCLPVPLSRGYSNGDVFFAVRQGRSYGYERIDLYTQIIVTNFLFIAFLGLILSVTVCFGGVCLTVRIRSWRSRRDIVEA